MTATQLAVISGNPILLYATFALTAATLIIVGRKVVKVAKSERPEEPLSNLGMLIGLGWSSEAVWVLTGPNGADLETPLRILLFAILEVILIVFMIRAKRNMRTIGKPGNAGLYARLVAGGMSLVAVWTANNIGEGFLRLLVPVLLILMWWDGLVGETKLSSDDGDNHWNWGPRQILIRLGAIQPGKRDVRTVHRERLTQRMTDLYAALQDAPAKKQKKIRSKLVKLTLDADDEIIREAMARVSRTSWTTAKPLPYALTQPAAGTVAQGLAQDVARPDTQAYAPRNAAVEVPPIRRAKPRTQATTSGYAPEEDAGTRAARYVLAHHPQVSNRQAAEKFGVSDGTVRNRIKDLRKLPEYAHLAQDVAQSPINGHQHADADN